MDAYRCISLLLLCFPDWHFQKPKIFERDSVTVVVWGSHTCVCGGLFSFMILSLLLSIEVAELEANLPSEYRFFRISLSLTLHSSLRLHTRVSSACLSYLVIVMHQCWVHFDCFGWTQHICGLMIWALCRGCGLALLTGTPEIGGETLLYIYTASSGWDGGFQNDSYQHIWSIFVFSSVNSLWRLRLIDSDLCDSKCTKHYRLAVRVTHESVCYRDMMTTS